MPQFPTWRAKPTRPTTTGGRASSDADERPLSDEAIVDGLARGEAWAADKLYDRIHPVLERTIRRIMRSGSADHDDLMQASFERIIRALTEGPGTRVCDLGAWSSAVASHVALDVLRRRIRERKLFSAAPEADLYAGAQAGPERSSEVRAEVVRIQRTLARTKRKHAEAVVLHDVLGHDLHEIAALCGVSVAAAQSRLVRGRKDLLRRARAERTS